MDLIVRPYCQEDYPMIRGWWDGHNDSFISSEILPVTGVVVSYRSGFNWIPCTASWIYVASNAKLAQIGFTVTHPEAPMKVKHEAVLRAVKRLKEMANSIGIMNIMAISDSSGLTKVYERSGFEKMSQHDFLLLGHPDV
jgi:hypothetical protein